MNTALPRSFMGVCCECIPTSVSDSESSGSNSFTESAAVPWADPEAAETI